MYHIKLTFGSTALDMYHGTGYDIATIDGLGGVTAKLNTVQNNTGYGEIFTNGTVAGTRITVKGYILDGNNTKREALMDTLTPLRQGVLTLYNVDAGDQSRDTAYRQIDIVVMQTPTVTQEKHCKFAFVLYAPNPTWRETSYVTVGNSTTMPATIKGTVDADYTMNIVLNAGVHMAEFLLYCDQGSADRQYLYLDFRRLAAGYISGGTSISTSIAFGRRNGRLFITSTTGGTTTNIISVMNSNSDLFKLPIGSHSFTVYAKDENANYLTPGTAFVWGLVYYPAYTGVALSGI